MWVGIIKSLEGPNRTKQVEDRQICSWLELGHPSSALNNSASGSRALGPWTGAYTVGSPASQAFGVGLTCVTSFSSFQTGDHETSQPAQPHETIPHDKSPSLPL